ncbi:hypothetical protein PIB30_009797 [Stylosanthes scabra]|uniref:Uncharacterized protein n=1 Tax=Stylosanthes scabra TaxID=79078 RepID=A0ABU6Y1Y4_9FABA|nr:hypothetical protein [Stylosanthes scabra]
MGSGVIYYEYEKHEKFEDYDMKADGVLGTFKISVRFDRDRLYEIPIEALMADKILSSSKDEKSSIRRSHSSRHPTPHFSPRGMPSTQPVRSTSSVKGVSSFRFETISSSLRKPRNWELILPSEGWMCDGDDEKEIGGMEPSVKNEVSSEEGPEEGNPEEEEEDPEEEEDGSEDEEDPEDGIPASSSLPMDIDAEEDYLRYINELERPHEHSPFRSSQVSVPNVPVEASDRQFDSHNALSYDLSGV